jgi:methylated-DNA-[protein]-cysteine S-methyltransferase
MSQLEDLLAGGLGTGTPASDAEAAAMNRVRAMLLDRAEDAGLLDVIYRTLDTPVGTLLLAATPTGLVRVAYATEDHDAVLTRLAQQISPRLLHAPGRLDTPARQLDEYLTQRRHQFELPVDLQLAHGFRRQVLQRLPEINYGHTISYAQLAAVVGNPRAVRAVGTACATNPLPLIFPCHRVIRSDGSPGAYIGGTEIKKRLVALELTTPHPKSVP